MLISFTPTALRQWTKLDPAVRKRIPAKIESFADSGVSDVKRLQGRAGSRLRIGDWRVIFYMEDTTLVVAAVGHRRQIYD